MAVEGIDVSNHQGEVAWREVAGAPAGIRFAWCKVSEGRTFADAFWTRNHQRARKAGLTVGGYHYAHPENDPRVEAAHFLRLLDPVAGDLLPVLDLEETDGKTPATVRRYALAWLRIVKAELGVAPALYTFPAFAAANDLGAESALASFPLWIAHWQVSRPTIPRPWRSALAWQYTSSGRVPGVAGRCDRNRWLGAPGPFCGHLI